MESIDSCEIIFDTLPLPDKFMTNQLWLLQGEMKLNLRKLNLFLRNLTKYESVSIEKI